MLSDFRCLRPLPPQNPELQEAAGNWFGVSLWSIRAIKAAPSGPAAYSYLLLAMRNRRTRPECLPFHHGTLHWAARRAKCQCTFGPSFVFMPQSKGFEEGSKRADPRPIRKVFKNVQTYTRDGRFSCVSTEFLQLGIAESQ